MKRFLLTSLFYLLFLNFSFSQRPTVEWENTIGGSNNDELYHIEQTSDGGYIMGGFSQSGVSGDKTEPMVGGDGYYRDYWIVKVDSEGIIQWQNDLGGTNQEYFGEIHQTTDGGFIVAGSSASGISGDKSETAIGGVGEFDYWVLKLNSTGSIVWQNTIGGSDNDYLKSIKQTSDGGYILGGYSNSGISGDKTEVDVGGGGVFYDYWIVKITSTGLISWQNTIGGNNYDYLSKIIETSDGGYLAAGYSKSGISGDKSEDVIGGGNILSDYWIIKLNSTGVIEWEETIGGTHEDFLSDIIEVDGGGYILGGYSSSSISGDKTEGMIGGGVFYDYDYWVIKVDGTGNIIWQNTFGAYEDDYLTTMQLTADGGIITGGYSHSSLSGDKNEAYTGMGSNDDYWIVKLDNSGNVLWQNAIGGNGDDIMQCLDLTSDGGYILGGYSYSHISGDKSEDIIGYVCCVDLFYDYWIVKLSIDDCLPTTYYADPDSDGYGNESISTMACEASGGFVNVSGDCNDLYYTVNEAAIETCDGLDNDCNGLVDDGLVECIPGPGIEWQNTIGGVDEDYLFAADQTTDNGFILGGYSRSDTCSDKSENSFGGVFGGFFEYDYWVVKTDAFGNIAWENTIGGILYDYLKDIEQTTDGGYILGGYSNSDNTVDKTETFIGNYDYWLVKLNALGSIEWQNVIGGSSNDYLQVVHQTEDGGYILGGYSSSGISGDKSEALLGASDYWIVKTNSLGIIEWQNSIGGSSDDFLWDLMQTPDGGYIVGGQTRSGISGDKTEPLMGLSTEYDYWILKLNATGVIEWQNTIGGSGNDVFHALELTDDGGYIVAGESTSSISGDKSEVNIGGMDFWIIKLDGSGNIVWQNTIGGSLMDYFSDISKTSDGGFLCGGNSVSNVSGDKTEDCLYAADYWVMKINDVGNIIWQNTIGGTYSDLATTLLQTSDGGSFIGGISRSILSGDKTEENMSGGNSTNDYWIMKLYPECSPTPELCNSLDDNCNGLIDDAITETISISAGGPITFCQGGNVLLTATYSGATVQWKKNGVNIPGATSSTYLVTTKATYTCVTTSPCGTATSAGIFVNVNKNPAASITAGGATTFCAGGSVVLTANTGGGLSYQWYKGATLIAGATSINYTATIAGNYKCRVTKTATGCFKNSNVISVSVPCKEGELINDENAFTIYPNPNDGTFTIEANVTTQDFASQELTTIEIYNNLGQLIYSKEISAHDGIINELIEIKNVMPGIYLIKLWNNNIQNVKNIIIE